jgi:predicted dehydrogenase
MLKIGIVGFGFIGQAHFRSWKGMPGARLAAVCDIDAAKFKKGVTGNIQGGAALDLRGVACSTNLARLLREVPLDAISVCVPTYLHPAISVQCLEAGLHVLCEKPMALRAADCRPMIAAARRAGKILQIGQCVRFWPQYAMAREIVKSSRYGRVLAATFQRLSATPTWSWRNWIVDPALSGAAALDLHIHDTDYIQYLFGLPRAVFSRCAQGPCSPYDHIVTQYMYPGRTTVTAEGGWVMAPKFRFQMNFHIALEKATLVYDGTRDPAFTLATMKGELLTPDAGPGDGFSREMAYFLAAIAGKKQPVVATLEQCRDSVRIVEAEIESARTGRIVKLK